MRTTDPQILRDLAGDLEIELSRLAKLKSQIQRAKQNIEEAPNYASDFYGSLALMFHNFYTGCERIFSLISVDLNGGVPKSADWHKRMLSRMSVERDGRKAVVSSKTARSLEEFLGFRHVVRNIYGFELKTDRVDALVEQYPAAWAGFEKDISAFVDWLRKLAIALDP